MSREEFRKNLGVIKREEREGSFTEMAFAL
jgi:hypothetical protein